MLACTLRVEPQFHRRKRPVGHSWRLNETSIPKASAVRGVTPNPYIFRFRRHRIQLCAILSPKLRNPYRVCFSGIYPGYHQHKGARSNGFMKRVILAVICVNLNSYIGPIKLIFIKAQYGFRGATQARAQVGLPTMLCLVVSRCGQTQRTPNTEASSLAKCRDAGAAMIIAETKSLPWY